MPELPSASDAGPRARVPAGTVFVPVRPEGEGHRVRLFRTPLGARTAVAFTSVRLLTATLGAGQPYLRLAEPALRALTVPIGVTALTVDPQLVAPRPAPADVRVPSPLGARECRTAGRIQLVGPRRSL
ncbi:SAV_915 family protein [Streptomyces sp. NRRL F-5126]|uniref:SAV_915 family protein n=1 Tax=Streptomyces sp. NRRL F-5126 TaxID=1463857 RepID=UPI0004C98787|nr:SAV_915 family protein [Streptomyces sp. NRRL F-5126]